MSKPSVFPTSKLLHLQLTSQKKTDPLDINLKKKIKNIFGKTNHFSSVHFTVSRSFLHCNFFQLPAKFNENFELLHLFLQRYFGTYHNQIYGFLCTFETFSVRL